MEKEVSDSSTTPKSARKIRKSRISVNSVSVKKMEQKARTPSGQILNTSVKDIRNFFSSESKDTINSFVPISNPRLSLTQSQPTMTLHGVCSDDQAQSGSQQDQVLNATDDNSGNWNTVRAKGARNKGSQANQNKHINTMINQTAKSDKFSKLSRVIKDNQMKIAEEEFEHQRSNNPVKGDEPNYNLDVDNGGDEFENIKETDQLIMDRPHEENVIQEVPAAKMKEAQNPRVMDVQLVMKMFREIKKDMKDMGKRQDIRERTYEQTQRIESEKMRNLQMEVGLYKRKTEVLSSVVQQLGNLVIDLERKLDNVERRSMRRALVITGLESDNRQKKYFEQVAYMLYKMFGYEGVIEDCFKLGQGETKPIVAIVDSISDKLKILQEVNKYRKYCADNNEQQKIYVSEYLPAKLKETIRRERRVYRDNEKDQATKIDMSWAKNGLQVAGEKYKKKVTPPEPTKILTCTDEELDNVCAIELIPGEKTFQEGGSFIAFALAIKSHKEIDQAYMKLRLLFPQAKHISCAYIIPGLPKCYYEDYCDDNEINSGVYLLEILRRSKLSHVVTFMVRIQEGPKIGEIRYSLMEQAVKNAFMVNPMNKYTNKKQLIVPKPARLQRSNNVASRAGGPKYNKNESNVVQGTGQAKINSNSRLSPLRTNAHEMREQKRMRYNSPENKRREENPWQEGSLSTKEMENNLGSSWPTLDQGSKSK